MIRSLIVAMARNRVIGVANRMPWHLPSDLAHFKAITLGHPVIMGRRTWESIGKALPGRRNLVVTGNPDWTAQGCTAVRSLALAYAAVSGEPEVFVIGGGSLYREALPTADRIYLTEVEAAPEGETLFPELERAAWVETELGRKDADGTNAHAVRFLRLDRRTP